MSATEKMPQDTLNFTCLQQITDVSMKVVFQDPEYMHT